MKKSIIKHSKYKNTGVLFELLVRQITLEILNNTKTPVAQNILKEHFNSKTELAKELKLYNLLIKEKYNSENRAEKFIDLVCEEYVKKIDRKKVFREKYELVKKIKENFDTDKFFSSNLNNYKEFASVYKLFESKYSTNFDVKDIFNSKYTLVEHVMNSTVKNKEDKIETKSLHEYKEQEKDLRLLTYKILVENFNKKYNTLNDNQRSLLKNYINNISNTSDFSDFVVTERNRVLSQIKEIHDKIDDRVTQIKLNEITSIISNFKPKKRIPDNYVSGLMLSYELISELTKQVKSDCNGK